MFGVRFLRFEVTVAFDGEPRSAAHAGTARRNVGGRKFHVSSPSLVEECKGGCLPGVAERRSVPANVTPLSWNVRSRARSRLARLAQAISSGIRQREFAVKAGAPARDSDRFCVCSCPFQQFARVAKLRGDSKSIPAAFMDPNPPSLPERDFGPTAPPD